MHAAVQQALGAVLRDHRAQLPRDLWRAVCMKCMLVAAESIDRMQRAMHAAPTRAAGKSTADGASSTPKRASGWGTGGTAAGAGGACSRVPSVPVPEWDLLDQAILATIQLRLRTYYQVLHESPPQVRSLLMCAA